MNQLHTLKWSGFTVSVSFCNLINFFMIIWNPYNYNWSACINFCLKYFQIISFDIKSIKYILQSSICTYIQNPLPLNETNIVKKLGKRIVCRMSQIQFPYKLSLYTLDVLSVKSIKKPKSFYLIVYNNDIKVSNFPASFQVKRE